MDVSVYVNVSELPTVYLQLKQIIKLANYKLGAFVRSTKQLRNTLNAIPAWS